MSALLAKEGITSFCPTTMTLPEEEIARILANVKACMEKGLPGAYPQGVNMEGPFIAMSKKGAQNGDYVRNPDPVEFKRLFDGCGGIIKVVDIAAECEGGDEFIQEVSPYCTVSLAHTNANYEQAKHAFELGITQVTHMFNAMSGLTHRALGVVGAVMDSDSVRAELICDGFHINPAVLRIAFRALGEDRTMIISDSMKAAGCPDGDYELGGQPVYVRDGKALLADGTIAASTSNVYQEFKNAFLRHPLQAGGQIGHHQSRPPDRRGQGHRQHRGRQARRPSGVRRKPRYPHGRHQGQGCRRRITR